MNAWDMNTKLVYTMAGVIATLRVIGTPTMNIPTDSVKKIREDND
jgi:hypothetical protein